MPFGGVLGYLFLTLFGPRSDVSRKSDESPGPLNISIWELFGLPKSSFSKVCEVSISDPKNRSDVTYIMVSAIFCFRKKAPSGRKKYLFYSDSG